MKKGKKVFAAVLILGIMLTGSALLAADQSATAISPMVKASDMIGKRVKSSDGNDIGNLKDLLISPSTKTVTYAMVDYKDRMYPVPIGVLITQPNADYVTLNMVSNRFVLAPNFPNDQWPDLANKKFTSEVYSYYGLSPSWQEGTGSAQSRSQQGQSRQ